MSQAHWRDRAITAFESISDAFDVFKAFGAHVANWVLFLCLVANLIEMVSPAFQALAGLPIVGVQSISLDIAGFGLTAMAASAKRRGDNKSANKANAMGWTLISVMAITVGLITLAAFKSDWADGIQHANQVLMFVRVIVTVFYGHIVHQLREEGTAHENRLAALEAEADRLKKQLKDKEQEVSSVQSRMSSVQQRVSSLEVELDTANREVSTLKFKLDTANQQVSTLENELSTGQGDTAELHRELNRVKIDAEALRGRLEAKTREVEAMQADQAGVIELRRELNATKLNAEDIRAQLIAEQRTVSSLRRELAGVQSQVSSRKASGVQVDSRSKKVDTGVDTGQQKVVQLDSRRGKTGQGDSELAKQIQQLLIDNPTISARGIAERVNCSPTTASEWKKFFEGGGQIAANG